MLDGGDVAEGREAVAAGESATFHDGDDVFASSEEEEEEEEEEENDDDDDDAMEDDSGGGGGDDADEGGGGDRAAPRRASGGTPRGGRIPGGSLRAAGANRAPPDSPAVDSEIRVWESRNA